MRSCLIDGIVRLALVYPSFFPLVEGVELQCGDHLLKIRATQTECLVRITNVLKFYASKSWFCRKIEYPLIHPFGAFVYVCGCCGGKIRF